MEKPKDKKVKDDKSLTDNDQQNTSEAKPVGYGSSIQTSGYGNRNRPVEKKSDETPPEA